MPTFEDRLRDEYKIELLEEIGEGAQAKCWKAKHRDVGLCAVKIYHHRVENDADEKRIIGRELEAAQRFQNPSLILPLQNSYRIESTLVTRWMLGSESLQNIVDRSPKGVDETICDAWFMNVAAALDLVHSAEGDWVHADVKPSNLIMLGKLPCLSDFGISYRRSGLTTSLVSKGRLGTRAYMPLSEIKDRPTRFSDVYAFLLSYVYLRQGRHPLGESEEEVILNQHKNRYDLKGIPTQQRGDLEKALKTGVGNSLVDWFTYFSSSNEVHNKEQFQAPQKKNSKTPSSRDTGGMNVSEIEETENIVERIIHSAALLEKLLRINQKLGKTSGPGLTLGQMIQVETKFTGTSFIKDLNFAVGIRNDIAHGRRNPSSDEKERAAKYLQLAILKLQDDPTNSKTKEQEVVKTTKPIVAKSPIAESNKSPLKKDVDLAPSQPAPIQQDSIYERTFKQQPVTAAAPRVDSGNPTQKKSKAIAAFADFCVLVIGLPLVFGFILFVIRTSFGLGGMWVGLSLVTFAMLFTCKGILFGSDIENASAIAHTFTRIGCGLFLFPLFIVPACIYWNLNFIVENCTSIRPPVQQSANQTSLYGIPSGYFESKFNSISFSDFGSPGSETLIAAGDDCLYAWNLKSKKLEGRYYQGTKLKDSWMNTWGAGRVNRHIIPKSLAGHTVILQQPVSLGVPFWEFSFPSPSLRNPQIKSLNERDTSSFYTDTIKFHSKAISGNDPDIFREKKGDSILVVSRDNSFEDRLFDVNAIAKDLNFVIPFHFAETVGDVFKFSIDSHALSEDATRLVIAVRSTDLINNDGGNLSSFVSALPHFLKPKDWDELIEEITKFKTNDGYAVESKIHLLIFDTKSGTLVSNKEIHKELKYGRPIKLKLGESDKYRFKWPEPETIPSPILKLNSNGEICIVVFEGRVNVFSGADLSLVASVEGKADELGNFSKDSKFFCSFESNQSLKEGGKLRVFEVSSGRIVFEKECRCFNPRIGGPNDEYIAGIVSPSEVCLFEWRNESNLTIEEHSETSSSNDALASASFRNEPINGIEYQFVGVSSGEEDGFRVARKRSNEWEITEPSNDISPEMHGDKQEIVSGKIDTAKLNAIFRALKAIEEATSRADSAASLTKDEQTVFQGRVLKVPRDLRVGLRIRIRTESSLDFELEISEEVELDAGELPLGVQGRVRLVKVRRVFDAPSVPNLIAIPEKISAANMSPYKEIVSDSRLKTIETLDELAAIVGKHNQTLIDKRNEAITRLKTLQEQFPDEYRVLSSSLLTELVALGKQSQAKVK